MPSEMASLIERHGGQAISAPALREVPLPLRQETADFIDTLCSGTVEMVVFLTGVGARALLAAAETLGKQTELLHALTETKVVCRGPKPVAVMRANNVPMDLIAPEPHTSEVLVDAILAKGWDLRGKTVALQHYGEVNTYLRAELAGMGANVTEISLYEWALPEDTAPLEAAIQTMIEGHADAVAFTTQSQVRHLFQVADRMGLKDELKTALHNRVAVAPVGPVCARALTEEGITSHVVPEHPKMGHLVLALADYFTNEPALPRAATPSPETPDL
jgi:uroporphyrinogen-III synthase